LALILGFKCMKKAILKKFGDKMREERKKLNLSQEELASRANVHRTYIGMIERAEKNITLENIEKISKALGLKISDFLKDF
jgi:transcriptional regulator with XRE-family HTH domain